MKGILNFFTAGKPAPLIEDNSKIDALYKKYRWRVMLAITVGYGLAYPLRLALSAMKKDLIDGGIFSAAELGSIGSALLYSYAFGKFFNGILADHANVKRFFTLGVLLSAAVNILIIGTTTLWVWIILWGMNGWFQGFGAPTGAVTLANWFSNKERGRLYGIWSTGHAIGEGLTFIVSATIVSFFGWQAGFWGPGVFGILVAFGIYYFLQDKPQTLGLPPVAQWKNDTSSKASDDNEELSSTKKSQMKIFKNPAIWVLGLSSALMYVTRYAINSWGFLYLQEDKGYSLVEAGGLLGLNTFAGLAGCVAYGYISDKLFNARRPPVTLIFGLIEVFSLIVIFFTPDGYHTIITSAFLLYGFTLSGLLATLGGLFAIDIAPRKAAGAAMGFIGIFSYIGAGIQDQISGILIENGTTIIDGVRHYDFSNAIAFWLGGSVLSMLLALSLWNVKVRN
ncbi:MAG: MFS transporter [Melioribacteraceae bacterium]|jgi:OPA family sugar phosphate sensor protein UhpC-like MFS transporter|nr:MFS transporter [Melioribacteraceae bacterium]